MLGIAAKITNMLYFFTGVRCLLTLLLFELLLGLAKLGKSFLGGLDLLLVFLNLSLELPPLHKYDVLGLGFNDASLWWTDY